MPSIYETVLYKRTPEELVKICKDSKLSKGWSMWVSGKLTRYTLFDSVTRERKYRWESGKSRLPFKKWYSKYCPKVSHDYTFGELLEDAIHSPAFHISLALVWIIVSSYIHYYKLTNTVSETEENKLATGLIVSSAILHVLLYYFMSETVRYFPLTGPISILMAIFLLINPIILPAIIVVLNLANAPNKEIYKEYLWKINTGFSALYGVIGLLMGWVSLWFWM